MLTPRHYTILDEIEQVSKRRKENWPDPSGPTDEEMEARHLAKLAALKAELANLPKP